MEIDFANDQAFADAVAAGIVKAIREPAFLDALFERVAPALMWLTYEQARAVTGQAASTWDRWLAAHRKQKDDGCPPLVISYALGAKEPRIRADSLLGVMEYGAPAAGKVVPLNGAALTNGHANASARGGRR